MATKDQGPEIDTEVAPCTGQDDELKRAMVNLRKGRKPRQTAPVAQPGRTERRKSKAKARTKAKAAEQKDEGSEEMFDFKAQLTVREMQFIELYLTGGYTIETSLKSVGYMGYHTNSLYRIGRKIVQKYEHRAGDHRKIMLAMGYGETKVLQLLIDSAENAKSEMVKLNARAILAKCLGMTKEQVEGVQGVQIVIVWADGSPAGIEPGGRAEWPAQVHQDQPRALPAPLSITR